MKANLSVQTKSSSFASGTVGGDWVFYLRDNKGGDATKTITPNASASFDVEANTTYIAGVQRLDVNEAPLGALIEQQFNTNDDSVLINTASALSVKVTA